MFRITIRDVLWLTVVVGLGCVLLVEHRKRLEWYHKWEFWSDTASELATEYIEKTGEQPITKHDGKDWERTGVFATDRSLDEIKQAAVTANSQR